MPAPVTQVVVSTWFLPLHPCTHPTAPYLGCLDDGRALQHDNQVLCAGHPLEGVGQPQGCVAPAGGRQWWVTRHSVVRDGTGWDGWLSPIRDVRCAQQCRKVGDRVAQGARPVALRLTGEEVEGNEGSVGAG